MSISVVYVGNTCAIVLGGLRDQSDAVLVDATVTLQSLVERASGEPVTGVSTPLALPYVADWESIVDEDGKRVFESDGNYMAVLPHSAGWQATREYVATVRAVSDSGVRGEWQENFRARKRVA